jgi:hypothetical protein
VREEERGGVREGGGEREREGVCLSESKKLKRSILKLERKRARERER